MGSRLDRIIHEHRRSGPVSASVPFAPVSWMSWRVSRIWHARGLESLFSRAALGLRSEFGQVRLVPRPQALRPFRQAVPPTLRLAHFVDGLVGVLDHMEPVDDSGGVGEPLADALGESQAHVARHAPGTPPRGMTPRGSGTAIPSGSRSRCAARVCRPFRRGIPPPTPSTGRATARRK